MGHAFIPVCHPGKWNMYTYPSPGAITIPRPRRARQMSATTGEQIPPWIQRSGSVTKALRTDMPYALSARTRLFGGDDLWYGSATPPSVNVSP